MANERYSDLQIAQALRAAARIAGEPLSVGKYDKIRSTLNGPSAIRLIQRFGSWAEACQSAGIRSGDAKRSYVRKWDRSQIVDLVRAYLTLDPRVSFADFSNWLKQVPDAPSAGTCRIVGNSWSSLLVSARIDGERVSSTNS
jgi:hypothetical protein